MKLTRKLYYKLENWPWNQLILLMFAAGAAAILSTHPAFYDPRPKLVMLALVSGLILTSWYSAYELDHGANYGPNF